jgi:DNA-binding NtrC family response regulator
MEPFSIRVIDCVRGSPVAVELLEILNEGKWCQASLVHSPGEVCAVIRDPASVAVFVYPEAKSLESIVQSLRSEPIKSPLVFVNLFRYPSPCLDLLKVGFDDFVTYPFRADEVRSCLSSLWARRNHLRPTEIDAVKRTLTLELTLRDLIGISPAFERVIQEIRILANSDATILITGETGTGKDMCARAIHYTSARGNKPFVPVNCGGVPDNLFENEFFGHERGAYTDARDSRLGIVRQADGGTVFLDDIESLSQRQQATLLRFLQDSTYSPLGCGKLQKANVRVLTATNVALDQRVKDGSYRSDLYYRLAVLELRIPSLRDRREDIAPLAECFVEKYCQVYGKSKVTIGDSAIELLKTLSWPGNVRELESVIHRAVIHAETNEIDARNLFPAAEVAEPTNCGKQPSVPFSEMKKQVVISFERKYLEQILAECGGNISEAARRAGKDRRAFWELLRKHHLTKGSGLDPNS